MIDSTNVNFVLFGTPQIMETSRVSMVTYRFYNSFDYDESIDKSYHIKKNNGCMVYALKKNHLITNGNRRGGFLGLSIEVNRIQINPKYDIVIHRLLDALYEKIISGQILEGNRFKIDNFSNSSIDTFTTKIRDIVILNLNNLTKKHDDFIIGV